jgi:hypothetical protein
MDKVSGNRMNGADDLAFQELLGSVCPRQRREWKRAPNDTRSKGMRSIYADNWSGLGYGRISNVFIQEAYFTAIYYYDLE